MKVSLVTGATGFIGQHLLARLLERGDAIRCLVRSPVSRDAQRSALGGERAPLRVAANQCVGDLSDPASLDRALRGVEIVYHLAGATLASRRQTFHQVNAEGTRNLAEACARQPNPPLLLYVSSLAAVGPAPVGQLLTEDCPAHPVSAYGRSKLAGEQYLRTLANRLPVTVLRPPIVFGPGESYTLKLFATARRGLNVVSGPAHTRLSWIYVTDLVDALLLAGECGQRLAPPGGQEDQGIYFVALDERPTLAELANLAAAIAGSRITRTIRIPAVLCRLGAWINACRSRITGRQYWLNTDKVHEILAGPWICSADKAKRELGFLCQVDLAEGLRLTHRWYHERGWLGSPRRSST